MKVLISALSVLLFFAAAGVEPIEVRVRKTAAGPQICVDGKPVRPRFYYGSPTCLCNIAGTRPEVFNYPFVAPADTSSGAIELELYYGEAAIDWYDARLIDVTAATTNVIGGSSRSLRHHSVPLNLRAGHRYRYQVTTRANHVRTYFTHRAYYTDAKGERQNLPFPYGDTLGNVTRLAGEVGVDLVTFSTDSSWGCDRWWNENGDERGYARLVAEMERLIAINPHVLLVPRVTANAPDWFLQRHPEAAMRFEDGLVYPMSSVSYRPYRKAVIVEVEKLARFLQRKFPRNFAGLHFSGQNSAEWFYMKSQYGELSGYDVGTRDAFREYLRGKGVSDWATAEVPTAAERRRQRDSKWYNPVKDRRVVDFIEFRNIEMASLLGEIGDAIRRATDGKVLSLFFYGYAWELGGIRNGAGESGHLAVDWLCRHHPDAVDGFSAPLNYGDRQLLGSASVMSGAESIMRRGYLWINEEDARTHREEIWDHMTLFQPFKDPWLTEQILKRDSATDILRGYGDWWMDLFGRGWHDEARLWRIRRDLNRMDNAMLARRRPFSPEAAFILDEDCMRRIVPHHGWPWPFLDRHGFMRAGITYGQYLFDDFVANPPSVKLAFVIAGDLTPDRREKLAALKSARSDLTIVEVASPAEITAQNIRRLADAAGCHGYVAPGKAVIEAAEGYLMVQAAEAGVIAIDFGGGIKRNCVFRRGEVRIFKNGEEVPNDSQLDAEH